MVSRLFLVYALAEVTAVVGLALTIGLGWTLLLLLAPPTRAADRPVSSPGWSE